MLLLAVLLFSNIALQLLNPQVMRRFIDAVQASQAMDLLLKVERLKMLQVLLERGSMELLEEEFIKQKICMLQP